MSEVLTKPVVSRRTFTGKCEVGQIPTSQGFWWDKIETPKDDQAHTPQFSTRSAEQMLRDKCEREWPTDFSMRAYCEKQQREAFQALQSGPPPDIGSQKFEIVRRKCTAEWPVDFSMRAYCEKQQYEAIRMLGGR